LIVNCTDIATAEQSRDRIEPSLSETVATMRRVLSGRFGIESPDLSESSEISSLELDSLSFFEYTFELEEALQLEFSDLPRDFATVGDLIRFVHSEVIRQRASPKPQ
jgi:acyl carrier protein